jgi:hypothetical protein
MFCDARNYLQTFLLKVVLFLLRLASGQRGSAHNCRLPKKGVFIVLYSVEGRALTTACFLLQDGPATKFAMKILTILLYYHLTRVLPGNVYTPMAMHYYF